MRNNEQAVYDQIDRELAGRTAVATLKTCSPAFTIESAAKTITQHYRIIRFKDKVMIKVHEPYEHYIPLDRPMFEKITHPLLGGIIRSSMGSLFAYLCSVAEDLTANDHYILFGAGTRHQVVWDMDMLGIRTDVHSDDCVWRSPCRLSESRKPIQFIMQLAGGDKGLYADIIQSIAPILMAKKPVGVIWWIGDNVDGKDTLADALDRLFPDQLAKVSVKQLNGGRSNTRQLNYVIGNVANDTGQVTDAEIYKYIGSHQNFNMHKYHSQEGIEIKGNVHHIFSARSAPTFYRKNRSMDRRTHTLQLGDDGKDSPYKLKADRLDQLLAEMCLYTVKIRQQGYRYDWSRAEVSSGELN